MKKKLFTLITVLGFFSLNSCLNEKAEFNEEPLGSNSELLVPNDDLTGEETEVKRTDVKPFDKGEAPAIRQ